MRLEASKRQPGKANALRSIGMLPGIVYNKDLNIPIAVEIRAFDKTFRQQEMNGIIELDIDGESHDVLVRQVQMDKRKRIPQHVDFYAVVKGQAIQVAIPVEYVGTSVGVRAGGQLDIKRREIVIEVLPSRIPNHITVDISHLEVGDVVHIHETQAQLPEGSKFVDDADLTLITIVPPRVESETTDATGSAEVEVIGEKDSEDEA